MWNLTSTNFVALSFVSGRLSVRQSALAPRIGNILVDHTTYYFVCFINVNVSTFGEDCY